MNQLTIEVDDDLLARAKELADARKLTVAEMIRRLLEVVTSPPLPSEELPPMTRQALGSLPAMTDEEVEAALDEEITRKHGL